MPPKWIPTFKVNRFIVQEFNSGKTIKAIAKKLKKDSPAIERILKDNKINPNRNRKLKKERENEIIDDYQSGMIIKDILDKYHIKHTNSIYFILKKRGIKKKFEKKRDINFDHILSLYNSGKSSREIGEIIGRSRSLVRKLLIENNIPLRKNGWFKEKYSKDVINSYHSGLCFADISRRFGCSDVGARNIVKEKIKSIRKYKGENTKQWNGGITLENKYVRKNINNKEWIKNSFEKNNYRSEISGKNKNLRCHHIYPFKIIMKSSLTKHKYLERELRKLTISNDQRFYDDNGIVLTKEEHDLIEQSSNSSHPYWKIWKYFPDFALRKFNLTEKQYISFNKRGQLETDSVKICKSKITKEIKKIIRYEHYLGTIPPYKLMLISQTNEIIAGIATFGQGANKNMSQNCWELTRLCVPYYIVRPYTIKFLNQCIHYIQNNYPEIEKLIAYADPNVGHDGAIYRMSGWGKEGYTQPSYAYFDPIINQLRHKSYCRRIKGIDKKESELAQERGLIKINLLPKKKYSFSLI